MKICRIPLSYFSIFHFCFILTFIFFISTASAQIIRYSGSWGDAGFTLERETPSDIQVNFSITEFEFQETEVLGALMKTPNLPGVFLPNDAGAPNLPGTGRYIAIPQGATASARIVSSRTELISDVDIAPAFRIPKGNDDSPLEYRKDSRIYSVNGYYPANPVKLSAPTNIRGVDAVILGITPFQYNPITKELLVYRDLKVEVTFNGGNGHFGEDRLRSRWFDPILNDILINRESLPKVKYNNTSVSETEDFEYVIITPNDPDFLAWADSIKNWRTLQGIRTGICTTDDLGGNNATMIESYINTACNTWDIPPVAILILGDYGTSGNTVHSPIWDGYCVSDHLYADVTGNDMADVILARITAQNASQLATMVGKFLGYESSPPTNPNFYNNPITAMGWQTERWFQICSESVNGFWEYGLGKQPVRENALYGSFQNIWSSNQNTSMVVNYFGPNGLGYIPATPSHLNDWGGNATRINADINSGAFMLQHRDHGSETGWGEPSYHNSSLSGLNNDDLVFVFSINCLTGKFNWSGECFAEAFHRHPKGALGLIAASEVSYSFVNDTYVWGLYDNLWPEFMPDYGSTPTERGILPAFGNAAGKYFLEQSSWPYNTSNKEVTYYLFHHHGDAFSTVYSEMPQQLTVSHDGALLAGVDFYNVTADEGSFIAVTLNGEILGTAVGTGNPVAVTISPQIPGQDAVLTVTKQNYYRYTQSVPIIPQSGPYAVFNNCMVNDIAGNGNGLVDYGESILLSVGVKNVGIEEATNVTVQISTDDGFILITDDTEFYGIIPADSILTIADAFAFDVDYLIPDGHEVLFDVTATDGVSIWESNFTLSALAPVLEYENYTISDPSGNNNGKLDPGETVDMTVTIKNAGSSDANDVVGDLLTLDPNVTIIISNQTYGGITAGGSAEGTFSVTADASTPAGHRAYFDIDITAAPTLTAAGTFNTVIGQIPALIIDLDENNSSAPAIETSLQNAGVTCEYSTSFPADANLYTAIFVCLGIYSSNHVLTGPEGDMLADFLNQGGMLFMEGGDTWYYDSQTSVHPMFNIDPVSDGSGNLGTVLGQTGTFTEGMSFNYTGENNWIDHINPIAPAVSIFKNQSPVYGCAVAYDAGSYKTIGTSFEFGGLADGTTPSTKDELMEEMCEFFGIMGQIPVELTSFQAVPEGKSITLKWETATELNNSKFEVERSADRTLFTKIGEVKGNGTTTEKQEYTYIDDGISGKGKYYYRLKQIDYDGTSEFSEILEVDYSAIPLEFGLSQNYPNPFNPSTTIEFAIPKEVKVTLKIYDALGREIETLFNQKLEPGYYEHEWNASRFASGVYFYRIQAGKFIETKKLMILK